MIVYVLIKSLLLLKFIESKYIFFNSINGSKMLDKKYLKLICHKCTKALK
jgi:hypothetical protein